MKRSISERKVAAANLAEAQTAQMCPCHAASVFLRSVLWWHKRFYPAHPLSSPGLFHFFKVLSWGISNWVVLGFDIFLILPLLPFLSFPPSTDTLSLHGIQRERWHSDGGSKKCILSKPWWRIKYFQVFVSIFYLIMFLMYFLIYMCIVYSQRRCMMEGEKKLRASDWSPEYLWLHKCGHCLCEKNHLTQYSTNSLKRVKHHYPNRHRKTIMFDMWA